ncbi:hypothetical protein DJ568_15030 [Mucilaginibacter hurinus]|uniref:Uncharacterized protein n=1 Tax=Mucilaginibacter hurinus TaxID=2201324 RepID=A0A367GK67_9SPHI|nr:hypothetical protein [Mucilaginibacter hurinus]RCH53852.1 hypothetical protein DJ568_15030 [Mucilaginibacter hurinus]
MKRILLAACMFAAVMATSCNPQGTSHSASGAEASPGNDVDTLSEAERDPVPTEADSAGRVGDTTSLKQ